MTFKRDFCGIMKAFRGSMVILVHLTKIFNLILLNIQQMGSAHYFVEYRIRMISGLIKIKDVFDMVAQY